MQFLSVKRKRKYANTTENELDWQREGMQEPKNEQEHQQEQQEYREQEQRKYPEAYNDHDRKADAGTKERSNSIRHTVHTRCTARVQLLAVGASPPLTPLPLPFLFHFL